MSWRVPSIAIVASVVILGALVLGVTGAPGQPEGSAATVSLSPEAGGAVCVAGGGEEQRSVDLILAAPRAAAAQQGLQDGEAPEGAQTGRGVLLAAGDDGIARTAVGPYEPGTVIPVPTELGAGGWVWTGWAEQPLLAWRQWRSPGGPGEPRGSVASRCVPADAPAWVVLGLRTDGGYEALLDIVNPYTVDATFAVELQTEAGTFAPIALRNVSVSAGRRVTVRLNEHLPEEPDVAAVVSVGAGRLAVEGLQRATAGVGGIEGMSTVPALTASAVAWTFPWLVTGPEIDGAVWVLNPAPREVVIEAVVHTVQGAAIAELIAEFEVPAEGLVRVDTADLAPPGGRVFGLTLRSATTGVYAAAGAGFTADEPRRTGLVRFLPSSAPDREWMDAGRDAPGRATVLHVVNLDERPAELRIALTSTAVAGELPEGAEPPSDASAGSIAAAGGALRQAEQVLRTLEPGTLAPGAVTRIVLPLDGRSAWSAVVSGGEALVVSRTVTGAELLEPVAIDGVPSRVWRAPRAGLPGRPLDGWVARLGTSADLRRTTMPSRFEADLPGEVLPDR